MAEDMLKYIIIFMRSIVKINELNGVNVSRVNDVKSHYGCSFYSTKLPNCHKDDCLLLFSEIFSILFCKTRPLASKNET